MKYCKLLLISSGLIHPPGLLGELINRGADNRGVLLPEKKKYFEINYRFP